MCPVGNMCVNCVVAVGGKSRNGLWDSSSYRQNIEPQGLRGHAPASPKLMIIRRTCGRQGCWSQGLTTTRIHLGFVGFAFQGTFQRVVEGSFALFVFLLGDASLLVLHLELEQFFLQSFEEH